MSYSANNKAHSYNRIIDWWIDELLAWLYTRFKMHTIRERKERYMLAAACFMLQADVFSRTLCCSSATAIDKQPASFSFLS